VTNAAGLNSYFKSANAAVVDIMPSIASHLKITIPAAVKMELDGIPLTGKISATDPKAIIKNNVLDISWVPVERSGNAKIWLATKNEYRVGGKDQYILVKTVPLSAGKTFLSLAGYNAALYKIVIETKNNMLNCWAGDGLPAMVQGYKDGK
jgi:hypothetical protein